MIPVPTVVWALAGLLFCSGLLCLVLRRQLLAMIVGLELMINAANVGLVYYAAQWRDAAGLAVALLVIAVAAAEVVVGFSLVVSLEEAGVAPETDALRNLAG